MKEKEDGPSRLQDWLACAFVVLFFVTALRSIIEHLPKF